MGTRGERRGGALPLAARDALARLLVRALRDPGAGAELGAALAIARLEPGALATAIDRETRAALLAAGLAAPRDPPRYAGPPGGAHGTAAAIVRARPEWDRAAVERLELYARVASQAAPGASLAPALAQAQVLFAHDLAFEVHEVLEPAWREARGDARRRLQGVIQAAVARYHALRGGRGPALRVARAALAKLAGSPGLWEGFSLREVERRTRALAGHLARDDGGPLPAPPFAPGGRREPGGRPPDAPGPARRA